MCDLVIAGNSFLQREAQRYQRRVVTLPSAVPVKHVPTKDHRLNRLDLIVGWVGSAHTLPYLEGAADVLRTITREHPFKLHIVSDEALHIDGLDIENIPWSLHNQEQEIARFDIGIMPLPDNIWTRGKCAYKLLQYMASGVPFVASAVGMNVEVAADGTTGFAVRNHSDFALKLLRLLSDTELRHRLGTAGRARVVERYSIEEVGKQLAQHLTEVAA
jgi:glycosyltransferase involved in cell wall biosynthesis